MPPPQPKPADWPPDKTHAALKRQQAALEAFRGRIYREVEHEENVGLRISEALGLQWHDVDWLNGRLHVCRGIGRQRVAAVKTIYSERTMPVGPEMLEALKQWRQTTQFSADHEWIFASPVQLGGLPWSYPHVWRVFQKAATDGGIGKLSTHTMRHSYRAWLDAVGTPIAVQQKLMRHADIRTTMNVYGDVVTNEMERASEKVEGFALKRQVRTAGEQAN